MAVDLSNRKTPDDEEEGEEERAYGGNDDASTTANHMAGTKMAESELSVR